MDTDEEPMLFKAQLFALTGVQPHRQKVILKGAVLKDDPTGWDVLKPKLKNGVTLLMMGTKDENALVALNESDKPQVSTNMVSRAAALLHVFPLTSPPPSPLMFS